MQNLPISISEFTELRQKKCVYVDKTKYAHFLITKNSRTFLSRPRRFGKSLFVSMLEAVLQGKKELFEGLWIAKSDYSWDPMGIIRLDFSLLNLQNAEQFTSSLMYLLQTIAEKNKVTLKDSSNLNTAFMSLIAALDAKFPTTHVAVLIDEYDYPIFHTLHQPDIAEEIRSVLKSFSSVIKAQAKYVQFVFVTGVSAFSKSGLSSGLNNLLNLTMLEDFSGICGYTEEEIDLYFSEHIQAWSKHHNTPYENIRTDLKTWYNGYCFKEKTPRVYSPFSLTSALYIQNLKNFWFESATPQFLLTELAKEERQKETQFLELDMLRGTEDLLQTFEIENLPLTALLFQMGYLTIDSYEPLSRNYTLRYPNLEVKASLHRHLIGLLSKKTTFSINPLIGDLYTSLVEADIERTAATLQKILSEIPYSLHIPKERFYHSLLQTLFSAAGINTQSERSTSIGRMDLVLELPNFIYIIELKLNAPALEGLKQIETQKHYEPFLNRNKPIRALGLSFLKKKSSKKTSSSFQIDYAIKAIS